jgi:hypothetical protein
MMEMFKTFINSITETTFTETVCAEEILNSECLDTILRLSFPGFTTLYILQNMGKLSYPEDREILRITITIYEVYKIEN